MASGRPDPSTPSRVFEEKIEFFLTRVLCRQTTAEQAFWYFSVSGGKDSYAMVRGITNWYKQRGIRLRGLAFFVDQWGAVDRARLAHDVQPLELVVLEAAGLTRSHTGYTQGNQAPCRACSDVRRTLTDRLIQTRPPEGGMLPVVARALHLTDTTHSLLWRAVFEDDPEVSLSRAGKAAPLSTLPSGAVLAKPLFHVREFESFAYAAVNGFAAQCCGCPACLNPSRRDIVEESLARFFSGSRWEFEVPGVKAYLRRHLGPDDVAWLLDASADGRFEKRPHLPTGYLDFAIEVLRSRWATVRDRVSPLFNWTESLDDVGRQYLLTGKRTAGGALAPAPLLIASDKSSSSPEAWMLATVGPLWGAMALPRDQRDLLFSRQAEWFRFPPSRDWGQVNNVLQRYRNRASHQQPSSAAVACCLPALPLQGRRDAWQMQSM